jgi:hypothetical protein
VALDFRNLPERVDAMKAKPAGNPRGKALEELVSEMFSALPGVEVADRNVLAGSGEAELDILLTNAQREDGLPAFGRDVLIECKSSDDALNSAGVTHFVSQVERRKLPWSIIVSLAGLTGNQEDARAAHHEIARAAGNGVGVLLFVEHELKAIRSPEHLAAVVEHKRRKFVGNFRAVTLTDAEIRELDPNKGAVDFVRGLAGIEQAIRNAQDAALNEMLDCAVELPDVHDDDAAVERAAQALGALARQLEDRRENPRDDPMWRTERELAVAVGGAFATLLIEDLADPEDRRIVRFEVRSSAPQQLDAHVGSELWTLLADYHLRQVREYTGHARRRSVLAMLALCADEIMSIDDIDPADAYDDYEYEY